MTANDDVELLRRYEPVLVFSPDERFFPVSVETFIRESSLWSVPVRVGSAPLLRLRQRKFKPQEDLDAAIAHLASDPARKSFLYLEYVDRTALFPLFAQAWAFIAIEMALYLVFFSVLLNILLSVLKVSSPAGIVSREWLAALGTILPGVALGLLGGGIALIVVRRLVGGRDAFSGLPVARIRSFQTLATLQLMATAIVGSAAIGPIELLVRHNLYRGVGFWIAGWLLAAALMAYIPRFFRSGILQLNSLFAIFSGLNDGTSDSAFEKTSKSPSEPRPGSTPDLVFPYYGRVWPADPEKRKSHQYVALQYWFFYAFNDWRTRYNGIDDHEGDWEHISIILSHSHPGVELKPIYLVYSQHILPGAYLRLAWNDPAVAKVEDSDGVHPVAYVAAGSHAHYYLRGRHGLEELLRSNKLASGLYATLLRNKEKGRTAPGMTLEDLGFVAVRQINLGILGQYLLTWPKGSLLPELERIDVEELVDYAAVSPSDPLSQNTGPSIGPGQMAGWQCILIADDSPRWMRYNGNWGKYLAYFGESAPRGPRFASKVADRAEWSDPINAAGLIQVNLEM